MPTIIKGTITQEDLSFADYLQRRIANLPPNTFEVAVICKELGLGPDIPENGRFYDKQNSQINTILLAGHSILQAVKDMQVELVSGWYSEEFSAEVQTILETFRTIAIEATEGVDILKNGLRAWQEAYKADILTEAKKRKGQ